MHLKLDECQASDKSAQQFADDLMIHLFVTMAYKQKQTGQAEMFLNDIPQKYQFSYPPSPYISTLACSV